MKMKNLFITALKVLAVSLTFALTSCDAPWFDPIEGGGMGGEKPPVKNQCSLEGTMVRVMCGVGVYGDLWIQTKDGKLLQPVEQSFQTLCPLVFAEGDKVKFGYRVKRGATTFDSVTTCLAALPPHTKVIVDCINVVPSNGCGSLMISDSLSDDNSVHVLEAKIVGNKLKLRVGYSGCNEQPASNFNLYWSGDVQESLPLQTRIYLQAKERQFCQAYFTQELCYDLSLLKSKHNQPIKVKIQDQEIVF